MAELREAPVSLRRVLFVIALVCMLSLDPVVTQQSVRVERATVEYVLPRRRPRLRGRLRGRLRRHRDPVRHSHVFVHSESFHSFQR